MSIMSSRCSIRSMTSLTFSRGRPSTSMSSRQVNFVRWDFELALQRSRVYSRSYSNQCDVSFTTSTAPTNAWSMLSGLSLNDISVVSAFRLPITLNDMHLVAPGSTFSTMFMDQALPMRPQGRFRRATVQNTSYPKPAMAWNRYTSMKTLISTSVETPENPVAERVVNMELSKSLPRTKSLYEHKPWDENWLILSQSGRDRGLKRLENQDDSHIHGRCPSSSI